MNKNYSPTKIKLITIARKMIDEGGAEAVNMRELGKLANLSRSAVYRHFTNKEALFAEIVTENFRAMNEDIQVLIKKGENSKQLIEDILLAYYQFALENLTQYQLMLSTYWDNELYPEIKTAAMEVFSLLEFAIQKAKDRSWLIERETKELMAIIFSFIHGLIELQIVGHTEKEKGLDDPEQLIHSFLGIIYLNKS